MAETLVVVLLLLISAALAKRKHDAASASRRRKPTERPKPPPEEHPVSQEKWEQPQSFAEAKENLERWRILHGASLIAANLKNAPGRIKPFSGAITAAETAFDPDILAEIKGAVADEDAMWAEYVSRFGTPTAPTSKDERALVDPVIATTTVRRLRAIDEQLARKALQPAEKPTDWDTFFAGGRIPLPPPPWPPRIGLADAQATRSGTDPERLVHRTPKLDTATARRWLAEAKARAETPAERQLIDAIIAQTKSRAELAGLQTIAIPPLAGTHRQYLVDPWGRFYLHLFPREKIDGETIDLVFAYGVKGQMYRFGAVVLDGSASGRAWIGAEKSKRRNEALRTQGYEIIQAKRSVLANDPAKVANQILDHVAAVLL